MRKGRKSVVDFKLVFGVFFIFLVGYIWYIGVHKSSTKPQIVHHQNVRLRNDAYANHVKSSIEITQGLLFDNNKAVDKAVKNNQLEKVSKQKGFKIDKLTHSVYYLHPKANYVLQQIGYEFYIRSKSKHYFTVTSLTRTKEQQKKLSKTNSNASPNTSTHSYGTSFDISYYRFDGKKQQNELLQKILESVLADFQAEKRIYVLKEVKSTCFHVTVRQ